MNRRILSVTAATASIFGTLFFAVAWAKPTPRLMWNASASAPIGLELTLRIALPLGRAGTQAFEVRARVQHSVFSSRDDGFRIGMVFLKPSDRLVVAIGDFLAR